MKNIVLLCLVLHAALQVSAQSVSGDLTTSASGTADFIFVADFGDEDDWGTATFKPVFDASYKTSALRFSAEVFQSTDPAEAKFAVAELFGKIDIGDKLQARAGRFTADAGPALFFHKSSFLGSSDPTTIFASGSAPKTEPEDAVEVHFLGDGWSLAALAAPFTPGLALPDTESPWFPTARIPETLNLTFFEATLDSIRYTEIESEYFDFDPSYRLSATVNMVGADLSAVFFHGRERSAATYPTAVLTSVDTYDLYLEPMRNRITGFGLSASGSRDDIQWWLDSSSIFGAAALSEYRLANYLAPQSDVKSCDSVGATGGSSWTSGFGKYSLYVFAECTWTWYTRTPEVFKPPLLDRALIVATQLRDGDERVDAGATFAFDIRDRSSALVVRAAYRFTDATALTLSAPFFFGTDDSSLGQYASRKTVFLGFSYRY